jgi:glutathione S-transferase
MSALYTLYDYLPSGNGYKVRLTAKQLNIPYRLVEMDILKGATRTPEFLAKNANGRIPLLEVPGRGFLSESHAIIGFLAHGSRLLPQDRWLLGRVQQWLSFEQYNLEPNIATVRFWLHCQGRSEGDLGERLKEKHALGIQALEVLERGLAGKTYLVGERYSLADIALYGYTHVAEEGGFDLKPYQNIREWLARIEGEPNHAPITAP